MSDKVELVAAAQVNAFGPTPSGINFNSNYGFETATRSSPGVYVLELEHEHDIKKFVIGVTADNVAPATVSASLLSKRRIQINILGGGDGLTPTDTPFFIRVDRVRD